MTEAPSSPCRDTDALQWVLKTEMCFCMTETVGGAFSAASKPRLLSEQPEILRSHNLDLKFALVLKSYEMQPSTKQRVRDTNF